MSDLEHPRASTEGSARTRRPVDRLAADHAAAIEPATSRRRRAACSLLTAAALAVLGACGESAASGLSGCAAPALRQFDFFVGDWDTFDVATPGKIVARNRVTPMLDGCAVREVYEQTDGMRGESISTYDAARRRWHQTWVTNRGDLLLLDGSMEGGRMILAGTERTRDGGTALLRGTWWREGSAVRERAERSRDGGATWTPVFDIEFRPHEDARSR